MNEVEDFLSHYGVKGQKWGVRRQASRDSRTERLKSGTATIKDRLIREADLDGGRTEGIRKGEIPAMTPTQRLGYVAVGGVLALYGAKQLRNLKDEW